MNRLLATIAGSTAALLIATAIPATAGEHHHAGYSYYGGGYYGHRHFSNWVWGAPLAAAVVGGALAAPYAYYNAGGYGPAGYPGYYYRPYAYQPYAPVYQPRMCPSGYGWVPCY